VSTDRGDTMRGKYLCMANGPLHRPRLPGVEGIDSFAGHTFHTTRWDYDYTGGGIHGDLNKLSDKRVAIIGTGATALQCVPHLGESAEHLFVVQRTPSSVDERNNHETDAQWFASLEPGWQQQRADNFTRFSTGVVQPEDMIGDGWTDLARNLASIINTRRATNEFAAGSAGALAELADYQSMERIRRRVETEVDDPATADLLKAHYRKMCKRPAFHDEFLTTFNRDNVTLIDTDGKGLTRVTENAIVVGDQTYEVDCLIFATGFEVGTSYTRRAGYEIYGRDGLTLSEKWTDGPHTQFGIQTRNFPNAFFVGPVHAATSINVTQTLNEQAQHVAHTISVAERVGATEVDVAANAEHAWGETVENSGLKQRRAFLANCTPGYYNGESDPDGRGSRFAFEYSAGPWAFFDILRAWRSVEHLPGIEVDGQLLEPSAADVDFLRSEAAIRTQLHPQSRLFLEQRDAAGASRFDTMSVPDTREAFRLGAQRRGAGPAVFRTEDQVVEGDEASFPIRVYYASADTSSIILYFHGGGGVIGSIETSDAAARQLANGVNATVISVDYRLAPEAPFPAAVNDAVAALNWTDSHRSELASEGAGLFVCGDSAGGTLATVLTHINRDDLGLAIAGQILLYPSVDSDTDSPDLDAFEAPILTKQEILWFRSHSNPTADTTDPRLSPTDAPSLTNLPPALILTAQFDLLHQQAQDYATKLSTAGVETTHEMFPGALHGFFTSQVGLQQSEAATTRIAQFIEQTQRKAQS
jgi:cyclohexanone monooxygenase